MTRVAAVHLRQKSARGTRSGDRRRIKRARHQAGNILRLERVGGWPAGGYHQTKPSIVSWRRTAMERRRPGTVVHVLSRSPRRPARQGPRRHRYVCFCSANGSCRQNQVIVPCKGGDMLWYQLHCVFCIGYCPGITRSMTPEIPVPDTPQRSVRLPHPYPNLLCALFELL